MTAQAINTLDESSAAKQRARAARRFTGPLLIGIAFVSMIVWTRGGWPDPLVDFGRELYIPWQLCTGKVLYRDIAQFNGPLSQYFNALLFAIFGVSLRTLEIANTLIAAGVVAMIYKLFRLAGDRLSATVAALTFVLLFMCLQLVAVGNYNWITPYAHELTHGTALALGALLASAGLLALASLKRAVLTGLLLGLTFLTKPEVFLAAVIAVGTIIFFAMRWQRESRWQLVIALLAGFVLPVLLSFVLLSIAMPMRDALRGTLGGWWYAFDPRLSQLHFYCVNLGTDRLDANASHGLMQLGFYLALFAPAALIDWKTRLATPARITIALAYAAGIITLLICLREHFYDGFYGLSPALALAAVATILRARAPRSVIRAALALFALAMMLKIFFAARVYHYGFVLAMPAMLVLAALLTGWLPGAIHRGGWTIRAAGLSAIAVTIGVHLRVFSVMFRDKPIVIAANTADEFRSDPNGELTAELVARIRQSPADATIAVLPQGAMVNYLARRENPTPYTTLLPGEVEMFGDANIRDAYAHHPPDAIVMLKSDYSALGYDSFAGWAPQLAQWISENYRLASTLNIRDTRVELLVPKK